jgi:non-canonical poly(A) RNA polymerase PAPD5/7
MLQQQGSNIQVISGAKVPIVKMIDGKSGCTVDISFNVGNGPENTRIVQKYLKEIPLLRPMILLLKYFLQQRGLNVTFSGSYCVRKVNSFQAELAPTP